MILWIILAILVVLGVIALAFLLMYNSFVALEARIDNAWAQIDVQTKRRHDLVPNLVEAVKGYTKHEKGVFKQVTEARAKTTKAETPKEKAEAENMLSSALKSLFAVAEDYPDLKASKNFQMLQEELSSIENKIAYARQFYNDAVMKWNQKTKLFPSNIVAALLRFKEKEYFEAEEGERKAVKVNF